MVKSINSRDRYRIYWFEFHSITTVKLFPIRNFSSDRAHRFINGVLIWADWYDHQSNRSNTSNVNFICYVRMIIRCELKREKKKKQRGKLIALIFACDFIWSWISIFSFSWSIALFVEIISLTVLKIMP